MNPHDTIVAVATPPGRGGVSIVRVSGSDAREILQKIAPKLPHNLPSHTLKMAEFCSPTGEPIDKSLAVFMPGPNSYTGEDVVEFQCHGGPLIQRKIVDAAIRFGARVAGPGEFTQRAFMNGKLDLTQAEAVADLINASSDRAHRLALDHLEGDLGNEIASHLEKVVQSMVLVEAALDFSHEEHVYQIERDEILKRVEPVLDSLTRLRDGFDAGRRQREGIRVVILGPPNAGKSTLFNLLVGSERAIVTEVAGTTRDYLEESVIIGGYEFRLIDTAGLRETDNEVEAIGIERSRELAELADVLIYMVDASDPDDQTKPEMRVGQVAVLVVNKIDIAPDVQFESTEFETVVQTSLITKRGFEDLKDVLGVVAEKLSSSEGVLLSRARHFEAVVKAIAALERTKAAVEMAVEHELIALDLREALDALGSIVGEVTADDILNRIFSDFCVGK